MTTEEEKKEPPRDPPGKADAPATPKEHEARTQSILTNLYEVSTREYLTPSAGDPYPVRRDPHLRLRRTLTPSLNVGIPKYTEAQFMLSKEETTGKRMQLEFGVCFDGDNGKGGTGEKKRYFTMDAYVWGASEEEAEVRMVTLHGISPGVSRTRWHKLGERYSKSKRVRFVALDWHSIDRSVDDEDNDEFLTCLPKHIMDVSSSEEDLEEFIRLYPTRDFPDKFLQPIKAGLCPRGLDDGGKIFRSVVEEGLGWGTKDKPFVLGLKSWSGGLGMRMLANIKRDGGTEESFALQGAVIMHPACFEKRDIEDVMSSGRIPRALMCWAKDDPLVPYEVSNMYLSAAGSTGNDAKLKLVTYESGGHHNFDGSGGLPNFDDEVMGWIDTL